MGQKLGDLEPNDIETAMFVSHLSISYVANCRGSSPRNILTATDTVVVARPTQLCLHLRSRQNINRAGAPPSHGRQTPQNTPVARHCRNRGGGTRVLVHVDPAMPTGRPFLETIVHRGSLFEDGLPHRYRLRLQCHRLSL